MITCASLFVIAFGNGLFKGNLQALVGQMYDNPQYASMRDSGFSLFYMFINIGAIFAPFAAVGVRNWWLSTFGYNYDADLPALCHGHLAGTLSPEATETYHTLVEKASSVPVQDYTAFSSDYLNVFTTGFHYAFGVAIIAMVISLTIYLLNKRNFPDPSKKAACFFLLFVCYCRNEYSGSKTTYVRSLCSIRSRYLLLVLFHQNGLTLTYFCKRIH